MDRDDVFLVRRATDQDASALQAIRSEALQVEPDAYSSQYPQDVHSLSKYEELIRTGHYFLAFANDQPIGMASLAPFDVRGQQYAGLYGMYVSPAFQGTGAASALVREVRSTASQQGYSALYLSVNEALHRAVGFYLKEGFVATNDRYRMPRDRSIILVTMWQPLEPML